MAGGPDMPRADAGGSQAFEPLNRALFRESALTHYERWGGDPAGGGRRDGGSFSKRWWHAVVAATLICLAVLGLFAVLTRVPVFVTVPVLLIRADGARPTRLVAVFPAAAVSRVRQGTAVRLPAGNGTGTHPVRVAVVGSGLVLTAAQMVARFPALAGAAGLPARGVLAEGVAVPELTRSGGESVVVTARGFLGDRPLIRLAGAAGTPAAG